MAAQLWNKAPFVRLLTALLTGIVLQWHLQLPLLMLILSFAISIFIVTIYSFTALKARYRLSVMNGIFMYLLVTSLGAILVWQQDVRNNTDWVGHHSTSAGSIVVTVEEPLVEKANSYKALASF